MTALKLYKICFLLALKQFFQAVFTRQSVFQVRELHLICLEKNVWENEDYQTAMKLLK